MGKGFAKHLINIWKIAVFCGLLVIPIDFFFSLKANPISPLSAILIASRSSGTAMLVVAIFTAVVSLLLNILPRIKEYQPDEPMNQAILSGSATLILLFFPVFGLFFDKYKALVILLLIGVPAALTVAFIFYLFLRTARRSTHLLTAGSLSFSAIGTLAIVVLFCISFMDISSFKAPKYSHVTPTNSPGPNVILIVMDSVRADHLSLYRYYRDTTPFLKKIEKESAVFNNTFAPAPWTLPSHASLFTGLYPGQHNTHSEHFWLDSSYRTLAEILLDNGYQTVSFSNNDYVSAYHNLTQGFERSWFKGSWTDALTNFKSFGRSFVSFYEWLWNKIQTCIITKIVKNPASFFDYPTAATTNNAILQWLNRSRDVQRPFFLFVNYMDAHFPYNPEDNYARLFLSQDQLELSYRLELRFPPIDYCLDVSKGGYTQDDLRIITALYDADIRYLDEQLQKLFNKIKELGISENTMIIITSDHGEYLGTRNRLAHGLGLHDELLHVPLLIRYSPLFEPGLRCNTIVSLLDIFETVLSCAKIEERPNGMPEIQKLFDIKKDFRPKVFAEFHYPLHLLINASLREDNSRLFVEQQCIHSNTYHLIWKSRGSPEFYNVLEEPLEENNLYSSTNQTARSMKDELVAWLKSPYHTRPALISSTPKDISKKQDLELLERLRGIGYVK